MELLALIEFIMLYQIFYSVLLVFPGGSVVKESACNAGATEDAGSIPGSGRSGGGHGSPLQSSCLGEFHGQRGLAGCSP